MTVMMNWASQISELQNLLSRLRFWEGSDREIPIDVGFQKWRDMTIRLRGENGVVYLIGNGASASMASHFSADLAKNAHIHTQVFSDLSLITAISNDMGYEHVFEEPLRRRGEPKDLLVAISSSGNSPNILRAAERARDLGMKCVTLSGMSSENALRKLGTYNIHIPGTTYGHVETCHAAILHHWMDLIAEISSEPSL